MKKTLTGITAVLMVAGTFAFSGVALADNGHGNGKHGSNSGPGNSAFGHSHNLKFNWDARFESRLQALIDRLMARLAELEGRSGQYGNAEVEITTGAASDIDEDAATVAGTVEFEDTDSAKVWFQYGLSTKALTKSTSMKTVDEEGSFEADLSGLLDDTTYYYRAVGQDENGRRDFGAVKNFSTDEEGDDDDDDDNNAPEVTTDDADDITNDSAELSGSVDMNDFDNGRVFFVWGQDEDMVEAVDDEDSFDDINEDGDDLQKESIENGFDGNEDFTREVDDLESDSTYYFAIGVEYENEDGDEVIELGTVRNFTTE